MADRKQFQDEPVVDPELKGLLEEARDRILTEEDLQEQRISFAFGNAPHSAQVTKDSVRLTSKHLRLLP